jgi:ABC-2 type transport system ATP-binding protein
MSSEYAIETEGLTKIFRNFWSGDEFVAVDEVSLRVRRGSTFGLLGPNGAGKTTFVKMLLSASYPSRGRALVFGQDSRAPAARRPIGYLPENHRFPAYMTGAGMLDFHGALSGLGGAARKRRIPELLALTGLEKWGGVRLGKYSKGMLQRVGLAQALLHEPSLVILDEPGDGVDPVGRRQIRDILRALEERGVTIFLNSHLLAEVEVFCRDVAIIHRGKLALQGEVKELTAGSGYRVRAEHVPERLADELAAAGAVRYVGAGEQNGFCDFQFRTREAANRALDTLRSQSCEIESVIRTASTLEDVFLRTVDGK